MKERNTTPPNPESGAEVAQKEAASISTASKFTPAYWRERIFRRTYDNNGQTSEVQEFRARIQHAGRREEIGLNTNDKETASRAAAKFFMRVKAAGWDVALAEFNPERSAARGATTVGDVIEAAGKSNNIGASTLRGYTVCFRKLAAEAYGLRSTAKRYDYVNGGRAAWVKRVDSIRIHKLTPTRIQAVLDRRIATTKGNPLAERRARITSASMLRQAKSLFSADRKLPFEKLPNPFTGVAVQTGTPPGYVSTVKSDELLRSAKEELMTEAPRVKSQRSKAVAKLRKNGQQLSCESYKALLLALGAGLRVAEIDNLQWQDIDAQTNTIRVMTTATFATKTNSSEREVFVDPGLISELEEFRSRATSQYVLESERSPKPGAAVASYRAELTFAHLRKWLRAHGVTAHKPIHTMRKEFGSLVCQFSDIFTASRQLGHASIALTATYYTENRRRVAPQISAMLNPRPKKKTKKKSVKKTNPAVRV